jgi:hypothetical protein
MKKLPLFLGMIVLTFICSSCKIPTMPPLDSTITIEISRKTNVPDSPPTQVQQTSEPVEATAEPTQLPAQTLTDIPPSQTPQPTATEIPPTQTAEPSPTATLKPSSTPTHTLEPTFTPTPFPYGFQEGSPTYLNNFAHPEEGCDWLGAAGQIFNREGEIVKDVVVKAGGSLKGEAILNTLSMPGAAKAYGPGAYELVLSTNPVYSEESVWIQLYDLYANPLSQKTYLTTYAACDKNLILLNFVQK